MSCVYLVKVDVYSEADALVLYALLGERTPEQSISHKEMPTFREHRQFMQSHPYKDWYFIAVGDAYVGSTYITDKNELGIFVFNEYKGNRYGTEALKLMMEKYTPPFYANINPVNYASEKVFSDLGFKFVQITYAFTGE